MTTSTTTTKEGRADEGRKDDEQFFIGVGDNVPMKDEMRVTTTKLTTTTTFINQLVSLTRTMMNITTTTKEGRAD